MLVNGKQWINEALCRYEAGRLPVMQDENLAITYSRIAWLGLAEVCAQCKKGFLVKSRSQYGEFRACSLLPDCEFKCDVILPRIK
jgi:hypothetical protein